MAYLVFTKDAVDQQGTLSKIVENDTDLANLNIAQNAQKIITISDADFLEVKKNKKRPVSYNSSDEVTYATNTPEFLNQETLEAEINSIIEIIDLFLKNGSDSHPDRTRWSNYKTQLQNLDVSGLTYPFTKTIEEHLSDSSSTYYNTLQIP